MKRKQKIKSFRGFVFFHFCFLSGVIREMSEEYEHKELRRRQEKLESEIKEIENRLKELRVRGEEREVNW